MLQVEFCCLAHGQIAATVQVLASGRQEPMVLLICVRRGCRRPVQVLLRCSLFGLSCAVLGKSFGRIAATVQVERVVSDACALAD